MASFIFNEYKEKLFDSSTKINWSGDTIKVALTTSSYVPDQDSHDFFNDVTNEVTGTGYTAGGATLGSVTITVDTTNDWVTIDAADTSWSSSTIINARYGVVYKDTGTPATSPLIALIDFGTNRSSSLTNFVINWNAAGIIRLA